MKHQSMTGFAAQSGEDAGLSWTLEARSVNAKGLDIRIRLPDGAEALEPALRGAFKESFSRGSIQIGLKLRAAASDGTEALNRDHLTNLLEALRMTEAAAQDVGVDLTSTSAGALLSMRGVLDGAGRETSPESITAVVAAKVPALVEELTQQRRQEGAALVTVLTRQCQTIATLTAKAKSAADARAAKAGGTLRARVAELLEAQDVVDEGRLAQELALLAVKADVTEEIDRLETHIKAADTLIAANVPIGRKLDFLMQEFNREANTLCSKAQDTALTAIGLDLKVVIDQMREQCQNLE